jgi:ADP-ribose pyrophosphatase YjhB (NUDIX family)
MKTGAPSTPSEATNPETASRSTLMPPQQYAASRATVWYAAAVLFTDQDGRVLIETLDYRTTCLLPGGGVDAGEAPTAAAAREIDEELGLTGRFERVLAVDWKPPHPAEADPTVRFPGEIIYVMDGGTLAPEQIRAIRLPGREVTATHFVEPADLPRHMKPGDARRTLAALRTRIDGSGTAVLEDGYPTAPTLLDRLQVLRTPRPTQRWTWHGDRVAQHLPIADIAGWLFAPDGRVLTLIHPSTGCVALPGGPQDKEHADPAATLMRHARAQARVSVGELRYLGYLHDDDGDPNGERAVARMRLAATFAPDTSSVGTPESEEPWVRALATPEQVADLCDWGADSGPHLAAVHRARQQLGLPTPVRQPVHPLSDDEGGMSALPLDA